VVLVVTIEVRFALIKFVTRILTILTTGSDRLLYLPGTHNKNMKNYHFNLFDIYVEFLRACCCSISTVKLILKPLQGLSFTQF